MRISDWSSDVCSSDLSEFWPQTAEGRILCLILSIYGFAIFGYVTATLASLFVGQDARDKAASAAAVESLQSELAALRADMRSEERRGGKECGSQCSSLWCT